jgi:hypothetical protein
VVVVVVVAAQASELWAEPSPAPAVVEAAEPLSPAAAAVVEVVDSGAAPQVVVAAQVGETHW